MPLQRAFRDGRHTPRIPRTGRVWRTSKGPSLGGNLQHRGAAHHDAGPETPRRAAERLRFAEPRSLPGHRPDLLSVRNRSAALDQSSDATFPTSARRELTALRRQAPSVPANQLPSAPAAGSDRLATGPEATRRGSLRSAVRPFRADRPGRRGRGHSSPHLQIVTIQPVHLDRTQAIAEQPDVRPVGWPPPADGVNSRAEHGAYPPTRNRDFQGV